mgnify:CR=1 FL=1
MRHGRCWQRIWSGWIARQLPWRRVAVAALRHVGTKVGFSSLGPEVALSAPGRQLRKRPGTLPLLLDYDGATLGQRHLLRVPTLTVTPTSTSARAFPRPSRAGIAAPGGARRTATLTPALVTDRLQEGAVTFPKCGAPCPTVTSPSIRTTTAGRMQLHDRIPAAQVWPNARASVAAALRPYRRHRRHEHRLDRVSLVTLTAAAAAACGSVDQHLCVDRHERHVLDQRWARDTGDADRAWRRSSGTCNGARPPSRTTPAGRTRPT